MKKKMLYAFATFILCLMISPMLANAWDGSGGGGNVNLTSCTSSWCFDFMYTSESGTAQTHAGAEDYV